MCNLTFGHRESIGGLRRHKLSENPYLVPENKPKRVGFRRINPAPHNSAGSLNDLTFGHLNIIGGVLLLTSCAQTCVLKILVILRGYTTAEHFMSGMFLITLAPFSRNSGGSLGNLAFGHLNSIGALRNQTLKCLVPENTPKGFGSG